MKPNTPHDQVMKSLRNGARLRLQIARDYAAQIVESAALITACLRSGGKLLFFGNGGSAADCQHLAAEFVGRFQIERPALAAIALTTDSSILTAIGNDYGFDEIFSRQIEGLGRPGDIAIGISTSGNSPNVVRGIEVAAQMGLRTMGFTGKDGGLLAQAAEISIIVLSANTARIQECHITVGHILCELVERDYYDLIASTAAVRAAGKETTMKMPSGVNAEE